MIFHKIWKKDKTWGAIFPLVGFLYLLCQFMPYTTETLVVSFVLFTGYLLSA